MSRRAQAIKAFSLILLLIVGLVLLARTVSSDRIIQFITLASNHLPEIAIVFALEGAYLMTKSFAWMVAYQEAELPVGWGLSIKLMLISCFLDAVTFPTVIAGDGFKLAYLRSYGSRPVLQAILKLRAGALLAYFLVASMLLSWSLQSVAIILIAVLAFPPIVAAMFARKKQPLSWAFSIGVGRQMMLNSIALSIDGLRFLVIASLLGLTPSVQALGFFVVAQLGGLLTGVPFGLGGREVVLAAFLHTSLDAAKISLILIGLRCSGELTSAFIGWLVAGKNAWQWRQESLRRA